MIDLEVRDEVTILRIAHGKANAMDLELLEALAARIDECRRSSTRAIVMTGEGKMFSAGVDLPRIVDGGATYLRAFLPALDRALLALFSFPKPVVAAVNGHAIAGGCVLACAADYRMMAREPGRIGLPELLVGVPFPVTPIEIMRFVAPPQRLQALVYRGLTLTADTALQYGIVDAVVDPDRLLDEAITVAAAMARVPAVTFMMTKAQLREPVLTRIAAGTAADADAAAQWSSPETLSAIRDYIARTLKKS
jgi:enoyl-CoA hydratase